MFKFTSFILLFFLLLIGQHALGGVKSSIPNIIPGIGVEDFFQLGMTYDDAEKKYVSFLKKIFPLKTSTQELKRKENNVSFPDIGLRLFFNDYKKAHKIVIYNPEFRTKQYVRVLSKLDDVISAYGKPAEVIPDDNGYYLKYLIQGIGFKIFSETDTVREIVIFKKDLYLRSLKERAKNNDAKAAYTLGYMFHSGEGITRNYGEAVHWYRKAAELKNAQGQVNLGYMYYSGQGVIQDYKEAARWFRKAAELGNTRGQANLGYMYDTGHGVTRNYDKAFLWISKAAEQDDAISLTKLGEYYEYGKGLKTNYSEALRFYEKAAKLGDDESKKTVERLSKKIWGVKNLQRLLTKQGFDPGPIDGKLNPKTLKAAQDYYDATSLDVGKYNIMAIHTYLSRQINKAIPSLK